MTPNTSLDGSTRQRVLAGAVCAFQERGIRAVSTTQLAHEIGISKATLYAHFPSKELLVREVLLHLTHEVWAQGSAAAAQAVTPQAKLHAFLSAGSRQSRAFPPGAMHDLARDYPALLAELVEARAARMAPLARLLRSAQQQGDLRDDIDPDATVRVLQTLLDAMTTPEFLDRADIAPSDIPTYLTLFIDGLFAHAN